MEENKVNGMTEELDEAAGNREANEAAEEAKKKRRFLWPAIAFLCGALFMFLLCFCIGRFQKTGPSESSSEMTQDPQAPDPETDPNYVESEETKDPYDFYRPVVSDELQFKLSNIQAILDMRFLFDMEEADYDTGIIKGYLSALGDPYTVYYSPEEYTAFLEDNSGKYNGIGVVVQQMENGTIKVIRPYPNCPGAEAGILKDDLIYKVDGREATGVDVNIVVTWIKGEPGTKVKIEVYRPSEDRYIEMSVMRKQVSVRTVEHEMLEDQIGYIEMTAFEQVTSEQYEAALQDLQEQGMKGLIVDLRDNGGGSLDQVVKICDGMLPAGVITYTVDKNGSRYDYESDSAASLNVPLLVLTNENTASASEIFTGAMLDFGVGESVGTLTFGKGIVQEFRSLGDGSGMKYTMARYYTPKGVCIHGEGIPATYEVLDDPETEADEQLQKALEVMKGKIH